MVTVCQKCGDPGYTGHLVYCSICQISAEHRYCLDNLPSNDEEVSWSCEQCRPRCPEVVVKQSRNVRKFKCKRKDKHTNNEQNSKGYDNKLGASKVESWHNPYQHMTCEPDMDVESPSHSTGGSSINCTSASSMREGVGDVSQYFVMQVKNNSKGSRRRLILLEDDLDEDFHISNVMNESCLDAKNENEIRTTISTFHDNDQMVEKTHVKCYPQQCRRRRLILPYTGQLDEDYDVNDIVNERQVKPTKLKESKRLILPNHGNLDGQVASRSHQSSLTCNATSSLQPHKLHAQPIMNHIWRGYFDVCNEEIGPIRAHISSRACERVQNIACKLPPVLSVTKLSRLDSWPRSFNISPPNDDNIALYFFDDDARMGTALSKLLDNVIRADLVLKFVHEEAELLVFSSIVLPESCHKFQGKHYLWGVFRRRQDLVSSAPADSCPNLNEKNISVKVNNSNNSLERHDKCHGANACHNTQVSSINFDLPQHSEDGSPYANKSLGERKSISSKLECAAENMVDDIPRCDIKLKMRQQQHVDNSKNSLQLEWHDLEYAPNVVEDIRCRSDSKQSAEKMMDDNMICNATVEQQLVRNWYYSGEEQVECRDGDAHSKCCIHLCSQHCPADCCFNSNEKSDINHAAEKVFDDIDERNISIEHRMRNITLLDYLTSCDKHAPVHNVVGESYFVEPSSEEESAYQGDGRTIDQSLNLFPMGIEDIAITSRLGESNSMDLELGLGWTSSYKDTNFKCMSRNDLAKDLSLESTTFLL